MWWRMHSCSFMVGCRTFGLLLQGQKHLLPLAHALISPSVQSQEVLSQRRSAERWLLVEEQVLRSMLGLPMSAPHHGQAAEVEMLLQPSEIRGSPSSASPAPT